MIFTHFLILDDDPVSGLINELAVIESVGRWSSRLFNDPVECLEHIKTHQHNASFHTCLMLDINMPKLNGWQFLNELTQLPEAIRSLYTIVIVTSSFDPKDQERADAHPLVSGYLTKPITSAILKNYLSQYEQRAQRA